MHLSDEGFMSVLRSSCTIASGRTASLEYGTPREFSIAMGCGDVESKERFPHPTAPDYVPGGAVKRNSVN
jgi:hypothetical protein